MSGSHPVLTLEGVSKRYRVRSQADRRVFSESLGEALSSPVRRLRRWWRGDLARDETFWALKDVGFEVRAGEVLGVIGKNGAGKSTLLKVLSRITEPTEGRIEIRGRVASLLEVGTGFHPELSGRENVYLNGTILGMRKREIDRKFDEIIAFAEVDRFIDTPVKRYSSGMYVRLAFAVAAHLDPEILFVDEVLSVGDSDFQKKCLGKMDDIAQQGRTVLFVSHNMGSIQRLCSRAVLLEGGRLTAQGEVSRVVAGYLAGASRQRYVAPRRADRAQFIAAEVRGHAERGLSLALTTDPITVSMRYSLPHPTPGLSVGIGVLSASGVPLFTTNVRDVELPLPSAPDDYTVEAVIPPNSLLAGEYLISLCLFRELEILDWQEPALTLTVESGPSRLYAYNSTRKGFVHVDCHWRLADAKRQVASETSVAILESEDAHP